MSKVVVDTPTDHDLQLVAEKLYSESNKDSTSIGDIIRAVALHFQMNQLDQKSRRMIRKLIRRKRKGYELVQQQQQQRPSLTSKTTAAAVAVGSGSSRDLTEQEKKEKERFLMFIRVLMKYLEQRDPNMHAAAKAQIKECYEKNKSGDPQFRSLTTSMKLRLRSTVGELYWKKAHDYLDHFLRQKKEAHLKDMNDRAAQGLQPTSSTTSTHRSTGIPPPTVRIPQHPQQQQSQSESGGTSSANSGLSGLEGESLTLDGFSTSATSSKHHKKSSKDKKKDKKSLKRKERKRLKKEEKRRRRERNEKKCIAAEKDGGSKKRKKEYNGEDNDDDDENCFWERDALGNIKKEAVALNCNYADLFDDECSESDEECVFAIDSDEEDSSSIEDVTELVMVKRSMEAKKKLDNAEEICDSDEDAKSPADDHQKKAKKRKSALSASSSKPAKRRKRSVPTVSTIEVVIDEKDIPNCPGVKVIQDDDDNNDRA